MSTGTRFLLDTNILSVLSPGKEMDHAMVGWLEARSDRLFLSTVTISEITAGIAKCRRRGAVQRAAALDGWLEAIIVTYGSHILPFDMGAAQQAGLLHDKVRAEGHEPGFADVAIAGTAAQHAMAVLTRNIKDFRHFGIEVINPFEGLTPR